MAVILVSKFSPRTVEIHPPPVPLVPGMTGCGLLTNPVYRLAHVDQFGRYSPWSDPVTVPGVGMGITTRMTDYIPADPDIVGAIWSIGTNLALAEVDGVSPPNGLWSGVRPDLLYVLTRTTRAAPKVGTSAVLRDKPGKPILTQWTIPNVDLEVFAVFVTENGMTAPGPRFRSPRNATYPTTAGTFRCFTCPDFRIPPGAKAYRLYTSVNRALYFLGEFAVDMMQPMCTTMKLAGIIEDPRSTLSPLQQALDARKTGDVVVVDVDQIDTAVPIIDQFGPERSLIKGEEDGSWTLNYTGGGEVALLVQSAYTTYRGLQLRGGTRATSNWAAGQAFGCKYHDCHFTQGIRTLKTSSRWRGDHTESETLFDDCIIDGPQAIRLEGPQTASVRFRRCHVHGPLDDRPRGSCAIWIDTEGDRGVVEFEGGAFVDGGYTLIYVGSRSILRIEDIFSDKGAPVIAEGFGYAPAQVTINGNAVNAPTYFGKKPWLGLGNVKVDLVDVPEGQWRTSGMVPA